MSPLSIIEDGVNRGWSLVLTIKNANSEDTGPRLRAHVGTAVPSRKKGRTRRSGLKVGLLHTKVSIRDAKGGFQSLTHDRIPVATKVG
jgi:hypothetical protein